MDFLPKQTIQNSHGFIKCVGGVISVFSKKTEENISLSSA